MDTKIKPTVSRREKEKKNFERQIAVFDFYDKFNGSYRSENRLKKFKINYDLANGRIDTSLYDLDDDDGTVTINGELVTIKKGEIPHVPLTSIVVKTMIGEEQNRPWKLSVEDGSPLKDSIQGEEWNKQLRLYIQNTIIAPQEQAALFKVQSQMGQIDPSLLTPEQLAEIENQVRQSVDMEVAKNTPEEIIDYMSNSYKNPIAKQAQEVLNYLDKKFNLKQIEVEGFTHMLPTGEEYYHVSIGDRGLEFDLLMPDSVTYGGPADKVWVQDMDWVKIETWTTARDIRYKYSEVLKPSHLQELDRLYEPVYGTKHYGDDNLETKSYMLEFSSDPEKMTEEFGNQDPRIKENFGNIAAAMVNLKSRYGSDVKASEFSIRECKIFWKENRVMYKVYRFEGGKIVKMYFDENYVAREDDLEVKRIEAPEVWECTKIGTQNPIYLNIRPVKGQYPSNEDPYAASLPVIGRAYNTFNGRSNNVTVVDLMKQFQRDYDTQMAALRKDLATNIGKIFVMLMNAKPKNMSWSDTLSIVKEHNMLLIDPMQRSGGGVDPQFFKEINMSKMSEIGERLNLLSQLEENLYKVAGFSSHRVGQGSQYANTVNIQTQQQSSHNQTEPMFETHRLIVEKAVSRLLNLARIYYKENPEELRNILTPSSYVELEVGYPFWYSFFNITIDSNGKTLRQAEMLKQNMQAFIQNGMDVMDVINLSLAESKNDVLDVAARITKKQEEMRAQAQQAQQEQMMTASQIEQQKIADERQFLMSLKQMELQSRDAASMRESEKFMKANDTNANGQADLIEAKKMDIAFKEAEHTDKMEIERQKLKK